MDLLEATSGLVEILRERYKDWEGVAQFGDTPRRLARMYEEFCWTSADIQKELDKQFRVFDEAYNEMLVNGPIVVWTLCPHHLLPCEFKVVIGYIPSGKVLGLSKFTRIAQTMGRRPIMQEQYSVELADELNKRLSPKGVAVYVTGVHGCMTSRGVRQHSDVVTSIIKGAFEEHPTREEFYAIARGKV